MGQSRGRRGEKKEKPQNVDSKIDLDADFIPSDQEDDQFQHGDGASFDSQANGPVRDNRASFFGSSDRSELEYFKNAESVLATNSLNVSEREAFIENLFDEAKGKESKLATNQVCSKLVERMTQLANKEQMQQLVKAVEPFAADLAFQKFSSHCLESIIMAAVSVEGTEDDLASLTKRISVFANDLAYDRYASHVLATLILSLSGLKENFRSKKSQSARKHTEIEQPKEGTLESMAVVEVPSALRKSGCESVNQLVDSFNEVDARKLAIDPTSSLVAQAIIMAEASLMSGYRFVDTISIGGSAFVSHCVSDSVGSHFLDTVLKVLPAKRAVKFVDTSPSKKSADSENEASRYLVQTVIAQSNSPKKRKVELLQKELNTFLGHNVGLSVAALNIDFTTFAPVITEVLKDNKLISFQVKNAMLYEKLSDYDPFTEAAIDSIISMEDKDLVVMATDPTLSYVSQSFLKASTPLISRRKLINKLVGLVPSFVVNAYGSHIVDSLWPACYKLKFARERIASELLKLEATMKHSPYGRKIWKNWNMEKYLRKRHEWFTIVKQEEDETRQRLEPGNADRSQSSIAKAAVAAAAAASGDKVHKKRKLAH